MISVRNLIIYSTIPGLFSSALFVILGGISIQFFYLLMIFNLFLMIYLGKVWMPSGLWILVVIVLASGTFGIARASDTIPLFAKQLAGITISALYFCCFARLMNFDVHECFRKYAHFAFYVAVLGLVLLPFQYAYFGLYRLQSVLSEPSMFVTTCLPALYYFGDQWQRYRREGIKLLVMGFAFVLAGSSVGFLGVMFAVFIFGKRYKKGMVLIPVVVAMIGFGLYATSPDFRMRLDDTKKSSQTFDVSEANLSTFALISNAYVTSESVKDHPVFGTGAGSHQLSYERLIGTLPGVELWQDTSFMALNAADANSLFLRVLSEFGLVGIVLVFWFIWHFRARPGLGIESVSEAIWVYFFVKLLRGGTYFSPEQFFFIVLYAVNSRRSSDARLSQAG